MSQAVTLAAVGDVMLGDSPQVFGYGVGSQIRRHGPLYPFALVRERLLSADIRLANIEVPISRYDPETTPFAQQTYRGQPAAVDGLVSAGINVVSVCTNHMMQHGQTAFEETVALLRQRDIAVIGAAHAPLGIVNSHVVQKAGRRIGFLAYNFRPPQYFVAAPPWPTPDFEVIQRDVTALRPRADVMVVTLHWGDEFIERPAPSQVELAHRLVDAGVDVIIGHHPHILQGIERYRDAVIAYSLGNFVYDQWQRRLSESMILRLTIRGPRDIDVEVEPMLITRSRPVPLEGVEAAEAVARIRALVTGVGGSSADEYERDLTTNLRRFRREVYWHYLTQFWRSNPRHFVANIAGIIRRRL